MRKDRLLNVAKALRESKDPAGFTMVRYANMCGTPACAFGHYASRPDLQDAFVIGAPREDRPCDKTPAVRSVRTGKVVDYWEAEVRQHFGLADVDDDAEFTYDDEAEQLFGQMGCGEALTAIDAALWIEDLVSGKFEL